MIGKITATNLIKHFGSPLFAYDESIIRKRARELKKAIIYPGKNLLYSCKANSNPVIMKIIKEEGYGIDAVSPGEVYLALKCGYKNTQISFTGNNSTEADLRYGINKKVLINVDSLSLLERIGKIRKGLPVALRINPDIGSGHHDHVITGGPDSKFGIWEHQIDKAKGIAKKYNLKIVSIHHHIGSGILDPEPFMEAIEVLLKIALSFNDLESIDLGGGLGVPYSPTQKPLDIKKFGRVISERFSKFCNHYGRKITLMLEPGRYLVCEAGTLLATVTAIKETPEHVFVGTDSGFNHLIRHAMYGAYHEIVNASKLKGPKQFVTICGNICESGDMFTHGREITKFREDDIAAIRNAGAYGYSMSMQYNMRPRPAEVLVTESKAKLIRRRETFKDILRAYFIT
jgi:diaminopimelate decarboxylase